MTVLSSPIPMTEFALPDLISSNQNRPASQRPPSSNSPATHLVSLSSPYDFLPKVCSYFPSPCDYLPNEIYYFPLELSHLPPLFLFVSFFPYSSSMKHVLGFFVSCHSRCFNQVDATVKDSSMQREIGEILSVWIVLTQRPQSI